MDEPIAVLREKVVKAALRLAADRFDVREDDPGWNAELLEEQLDDVVREFVARHSGLIHMPKYLDDIFVAHIAADSLVRGRTGDQVVRRIWHLVREEMKANG
jgi:hypothetical protein